MATQIKICGITNRADAELALRLGADYLGIIVYPKSPRAVAIGQLPALLEVIPPGKRVMVDVATGTDVLESYLPYQFDAYQIHFDLDIAIASVAAWSGIVGQHALWLAPRIAPDEPDFPQILLEFADTVVLDAYDAKAYGGTGRAGTNWQRFIDCSVFYQHKRWVLAGGLGPDNLAQALAVTEAAMVDVNSGVESTPGRKDPQRLQAVFEILRKYNDQSV